MLDAAIMRRKRMAVECKERSEAHFAMRMIARKARALIYFNRVAHHHID
jgi:hypothetical protein